MGKICKNCEEKPAEKYSPYSNGEHCSRECARAYSTKLKRKEINENVSKTLTGSGHGDVTKNCPTCKKDFTLEFRRRHRTYCSPKCSNNAPSVKEKISIGVKAVKLGSIKPKTIEEIRLRKENLRKRKTLDWNKENGISNS